MMPMIKRCVDTALNALITFVIGQAIAVLKEDLDAMKKNNESKED